jgi:C1A family cysteine protease
MKKLALTVVIAAILGTAVATAKRPKAHELSPAYTFAHYARDFGKKYHAAEYVHREALFRSELHRVLAHNSDKTQLWKMGVNQFSDWTAEEKKKLYKGARPADGRVPELKIKPGVHKTRSSKVPLPFSVDYRLANPPVLTSVKDQGQCGSCWAHATTEGVESAYTIATGQRYVLSQQQITSCTSDQYGNGCNGNWPKIAWSYVVGSTGVTQEWVQGYQSYNGAAPNCSALPATQYQVPLVTLTGYNEVPHNDADTFAEALATIGPLAILVDASSWSPYESGIFTQCQYDSNFGLDHAVQAVGYGTDSALNQNYWIVRNSWNAGWGENGYIRLLKEPTGTTNCGWVVSPTLNTQGQNVTVCGMCGLYMEPLYGIAGPAQ